MRSRHILSTFIVNHVNEYPRPLFHLLNILFFFLLLLRHYFSIKTHSKLFPSSDKRLAENSFTLHKISEKGKLLTISYLPGAALMTTILKHLIPPARKRNALVSLFPGNLTQCSNRPWMRSRARPYCVWPSQTKRGHDVIRVSCYNWRRVRTSSDRSPQITTKMKAAANPAWRISVMNTGGSTSFNTTRWAAP